jgi:hypothetical protein
MQSACTVLYCHLWPVRHCHIFPRYLINGTIFGKNVTQPKRCILIFSASFVWNISHYKKNETRYYHKCTNVFTWRTHYIGRILTKLEFYRHIFKKTNVKFHENPSSGSRERAWINIVQELTKLRNVPSVKNLSCIIYLSAKNGTHAHDLQVFLEKAFP